MSIFFEAQDATQVVLLEIVMDQLAFGSLDIDALTTARAEHERDAESGRSKLTSASGGDTGRSFSIERLWDVLHPAAAIF